MKYSERAVALRDISLPIKAGQKVVVCGRTGRLDPQHKQTLISLLYQI